MNSDSAPVFPLDLIGKISNAGIWDKINNPLVRTILNQEVKNNG